MGQILVRLAELGVDLVCPACAADLREEPATLECAGCGRAYPILAGLPDLRLTPDRFLSLESDREKGMAAIDRARGGGFRGALEAYWRLTPELAPQLAARHLARQLAERAAGEHLFREVEGRCGALEGPILDAGCGLGGFVAAAARRGLPVVGVDAAFRWALMAKLLLAEAGATASLLCANAEHPPFRSHAFGTVVANDLIEHVRDPAAAVSGVAGALRRGGAAYFASTHRYSLAPEPHVRLLGVGWLPRTWQSAYVQWRRGHAYDRVRPVGSNELRRVVRQAGLQPGKVFAAPVFADHLRVRDRAALRLLERAPWWAPRIGVVGR